MMVPNNAMRIKYQVHIVKLYDNIFIMGANVKLLKIRKHLVFVRFSL